MNVRIVALTPFFLLLVGVGILFWHYRAARSDADRGWAAIAAHVEVTNRRFSADQVAGLPETARRYFQHAITPGTPLKKTVELAMKGTFRLGDKSDLQPYEMEARQILAPPDQFVWIPTMRRGIVQVSGSDALVSGEAWTRFWLGGLVPVADSRTSPDLVRSAQFRSAIEGIWAPAALLPRSGIVWTQPSANVARVTIETTFEPIVLDLTLSADGAVREVAGMRWSNANIDKVFRAQPFGGIIHQEDTFEGYTIPSEVWVGNHFGTDEFFPFFEAEIVRAHYL